MAWGGTQTVLTPALRIVSIAAAGILGLFALVMRRRAGLSAAGQPSRGLKILAWVITGFLALNALGNFASLSRGDALLFGPIALVLVLACLIVPSSSIARNTT